MYYKTDQKQIEFEPESVNQAYNEGYVLTRLGKGVVNQTRSLRIGLFNFELNSENRRILRKTEGLNLEFKDLPLEDYSWEIHKMGKDFYSTKFGEDTMSASKIKEMFNDIEASNMNGVFVFEFEGKSIGYCLTYSNSQILHYAYPFYDLEFAEDNPNIGLGMMIRAINWSKENGKEYIYLGSVVDESSKYKLQFSGLEWFDGDGWSIDIEKLKSHL